MRVRSIVLSVFSAFSSVAAAVAYQFHRTFAAVIAIMLHVQSVIRYRQAPGIDEILSRYDGKIVMCQRMPDIFSEAMGNQMYMALSGYGR